MSGGLTRRKMFGLAGAGAVTATLVGTGIYTSQDETAAAPDAQRHDFYGPHQAGVITPAQDRLHFAAFDVTTDSRDELIALLQAWTVAAARMTQGLPAGEFGPVDGPYLAPPDDTGEAMDLSAGHLTLTFGFGPSLFRDSTGTDRFNIADRSPALLSELPHFPGDKLVASRSGGDICVQACADDPQVAVHAIRNLARIGFGKVTVRWSQLGFGRTASTSTAQTTPRNLFGFKDGTANLKAEDTSEIDAHVWVHEGDDAGAKWMNGGSFLVSRRINMHIETWDRTPLSEQEALIGRGKGSGAPLSGGTEFSAPDFTLPGKDAEPLVPMSSHVRHAHPSQNGGARMLRRGYNFTDGTDGFGRLDAGLFFIAYVRNPAKQYIPMQTKLAKEDALSEYLQHTGSALFAVPPGVMDSQGWVGSTLFA